MKQIVIAFSLVALASSAFAQDVSVVVSANEKTIINTFAQHGADCKPLKTKPIVISKQPKNGLVEIKKADVTVAVTDHTNCVGKKLSGVEVYYTPKKGFSGSDALSVRVPGQGNSSSEVTFRIQVK